MNAIIGLFPSKEDRDSCRDQMEKKEVGRLSCQEGFFLLIASGAHEELYFFPDADSRESAIRSIGVNAPGVSLLSFDGIALIARLTHIQITASEFASMVRLHDGALVV